MSGGQKNIHTSANNIAEYVYAEAEKKNVSYEKGEYYRYRNENEGIEPVSVGIFSIFFYNGEKKPYVV